jgi:uncharacterized membrane protein
MKPIRIEHTTYIEAPLRVVWDLTVDVDALPTITPTITRVDRLDDDELVPGSQAKLKQPGQRERVWTVTELDEPTRFAWSTHAMGVTTTGSHALAESTTGTTNMISIDLRGPLAPAVGFFLKAPIRRALMAENEGLKTAAESTKEAIQ